MSAQTVYRLTFEIVSAVAHPQYYRNEKPTVPADQVPDEYWHTVERTASDVHGQYIGLRRLIDQGELIRNVHLFEGEATEVSWREVGS